MSKFFRLCSCEFTKIIKKRSTKVMLIILVISLFAAAGIAQLTKSMYNIIDEAYTTMDYKENIKLEIEEAKTELSNENLDEASKNSMQAQIDTLQLAIDNDINVYNTYWKSDLLDNIETSKREIYNYKSMEMQELADKKQSDVDKKIQILKDDDFSAYMKLQKEELKATFEDGIIEEQEYNDAILVLDLKEKYEIGKIYNSDENWKKTLIEEIEVLKQNIRSGIDITTRKSFN